MWSPFANFWLYGATANITAAKAAGVRIACARTGPFGHRNILWELNVADLWNQAQPTPVFTDQELAQLVTTNPGHAQATETDIRFVLIGGRPCYGTRSLMTAARATTATPLRVGQLSRAIDYGDPSITFANVLAELNRVRTNPQQAVTQAVAALQTIATAGLTVADAPFVLLPDMPTPETSTAPPPPSRSSPPSSSSLPPNPLPSDGPGSMPSTPTPSTAGLLSSLRNYT